MPERDRVGADPELGSPFLGDGFGEPRDAGFGEAVVGLAGVARGAGCGGNVDDAAGGAVFEAEVGGGGADESEGGGVVEGENRVPLFVGHLGFWKEQMNQPADLCLSYPHSSFRFFFPLLDLILACRRESSPCVSQHPT